MKHELIVKVVRPLTATAPWHVYDLTRTINTSFQESAIPGHVKQSMGTTLQGYFIARRTDDNSCVIGKRAPPQRW